MANFVPREISADMAAKGYNNAGRGKMLGYIAVPDQHEETCRYRISTGGDPNKEPHEMCSCRIGLWQEEVLVKQKPAKRKKVKKKMAKKAKKKPKKKS